MNRVPGLELRVQSNKKAQFGGRLELGAKGPDLRWGKKLVEIQSRSVWIPGWGGIGLGSGVPGNWSLSLKATLQWGLRGHGAKEGAKAG